MSNRQVLSDAEYANKAIITYPRFEALLKDMEECWELTQIAREPQCMALEGVTGVGKSTLVEAFMLRQSRRMGGSGDEIPILYIETPSPARIKAVASVMLKSLGDPLSGRGTEWSLNLRVIDFIEIRRVRMVVYDDFQHFYDKRRGQPLMEISDWLKYMIKETGVMYMVVGKEGEINRILQANAQLSRLFAVREVLSPFAWDRSNEDDVKTFGRFIHLAEQTIGVELNQEVSRQELLNRIHYATDGVVSNIMRLLRAGGLRAQNQASDVLEMQILSQVFQKFLVSYLPHKVDPFDQRWGEKFPGPDR